jgi:hypothetical protein
MPHLMFVGVTGQDGLQGLKLCPQLVMLTAQAIGPARESRPLLRHTGQKPEVGFRLVHMQAQVVAHEANAGPQAKDQRRRLARRSMHHLLDGRDRGQERVALHGRFKQADSGRTGHPLAAGKLL